MIGTVDSINYDGNRVLKVVLRFPSRATPSGVCKKEIRTSELIGQGSFGTVYRAICEDYPHLALKISTGKATRLRRELEVLSHACTKGKLHLPRFEFGALNQSEDLVVIGMELCVPRTLHELIVSKPLAYESDMLFLAYQAALAVSFVHEEGCIHRDVKLQNFVFDLDGNVKLIDFGLSCNQMDPPPGDVVAGTVAFMAPEMAHNALYKDKRVSVGAPADVWSLGIVWFSIFTKQNPYHWVTAQQSAGPDNASSIEESVGLRTNTSVASAHAADLQRRQNKQLLECVAAADWRWPEPCMISKDLKVLVESVLCKTPAERPNLEEILRQPIWDRRRRSPPEDVMCFLGVQDDFLLSHDEAHLMRAVEQRSAGVSASLLNSRAQSPRGGDGEAKEVWPNGEPTVCTAFTPPHSRVGSLKVVARDECDVGGVPSVQVYDIRASAHKRSKPIRDISVVIAEETAKKTRSRSRKGLKPRGDGGASVRSTATAPTSRASSVNSSKRVQPGTNPGKGGAQAKTASTSRFVGANGSHVGEPKRVETKPTTSSAVSKPSQSSERGVSSAVPAKEVESRLPVSHSQQGDPMLSLEESISLVGSSEVGEPSDDVVVEYDEENGDLASISNGKVQGKETHQREGSQILVHEEVDEATSRIFHIVAPSESEHDRPARKRLKHDASKPKTETILDDIIPRNGFLSSVSRSQSEIASIIEKSLSKRDIQTKPSPIPQDGGPYDEALPIVLKEDHSPVTSETKDPFLTSRSHNIPHATANRRAPPAKAVVQAEPRLVAGMRHGVEQHKQLASILLLQHEWLLSCFRIVLEEDQERYNITWLAEEQAKSASHAHRFKEVTQITARKYRYGIVCDLCDYEFLPEGRQKNLLHFFHCSCGRDLCPECYVEYEKRCTCDCCGTTHPNSHALRLHLDQMTARKAQVVTAHSTPRRRGHVEEPSQPTVRVSVAALHQKVIKKPAVEEEEEERLPVARAKRRVEAIPEGPWKPFAGLRSDRPMALTPALQEEREVILKGEWIRYFHLHPMDPENEPFAFVYHIQPGRTGAIFLTSEFPVHSAVISMLERQFFVVDRVDMEEGDDVTRVTTLVKAKVHPSLSSSFRALQEIEAFDTNAMKQKRAPGTVSVYQAPRSAYSCSGDPFVYLRWFRFNEDRKISAFLLSNGGVQVFVNNEFELRWFDENHKFLVRCNGVCEIVGDSTFTLAPAINHLLYDTF